MFDCVTARTAHSSHGTGSSPCGTGSDLYYLLALHMTPPTHMWWKTRTKMDNLLNWHLQPGGINILGGGVCSRRGSHSLQGGSQQAGELQPKTPDKQLQPKLRDRWPFMLPIWTKNGCPWSLWCSHPLSTMQPHWHGHTNQKANSLLNPEAPGVVAL